MVECNKVNVKLSDSQLNKLKTAVQTGPDRSNFKNEDQNA